MSLLKGSSQRSWNRRPIFYSGIRASVKRPQGFDYQSRDNTIQSTWHHGESSRTNEGRTYRSRLGVASAFSQVCQGGRSPHRLLSEPYYGDQTLKGSSSGTQNSKDKQGLMKNFQHKDMADWKDKNYTYADGKGKKALTDKFHIQCFNCANFGHFANKCPFRKNFKTKAKISEFLVLGTEQKTWNDIWFLNLGYDDHTCFKRNMFSEFMDVDSIPLDCELEMDNKCKGIGEVLIENGVDSCLIPCVLYKPNTTKNILSMATLIKQGFMVKLMGDKASIKPMFQKTYLDHSLDISKMYEDDSKSIKIESDHSKNSFNEDDCNKDYEVFLKSQNVIETEKGSKAKIVTNEMTVELKAEPKEAIGKCNKPCSSEETDPSIEVYNTERKDDDYVN